MNIRELIQRVRNRIMPREEIPNEVVLGILKMLEDVHKDELSCDEIFDKLDEYVECEVGSKDASELMPLIREHLDICSGCCEEYEVLLDVVEKTDEKKANN